MKFIGFLALPFWLFGANLSEIINLAQKNEISQIKNSEILEANLNYDSVKSGYLPSLSLNGGYQNISGNKTLLEPKHGSQIVAKIEFLIYDGGSREANLRGLKHKISASKFDYENLQNFLALNGVKLYFGYLSLQKVIGAKIAQKNYISATLKKLEKYHKAGLSAIDELEVLRANFYLIEAEILAYNEKLSEIKNEIKLLTNAEISPILGDFIAMPNFNFKSENANLKKLNELNLASLELENAQNGELLPKIFISDSYGYYYNSVDFLGDFSPLLTNRSLIEKYYPNERFQNRLFLGFEWKIFDFFSTSKKSDLARLNYQKSSLNKVYESRKNKLNLQNLKNKINAKTALIKANEARFKATKIAAKSSKEKYDAGLLSYNDYINAISGEFEAKSELEIAKAEFEILKAEYFYENGENIAIKVEK